jgi:hypothetical protein
MSIGNNERFQAAELLDIFHTAQQFITGGSV